jgi:hypothetical protein
VELYLERASDAWSGLQVLAEAEAGRYAVDAVIATGVGPLRRQLDSGYRGAAYDFVSATSPARGTIAFALDTRRARTEVRAQSTQLSLIQELVRRAARDDNDDPRLGHTLLNLLVPAEVRPFLGGSERLLLELDPATAAIPWELLDTRGPNAAAAQPGSGEAPWAVRTAVLRKLRTTQFRQQVQDARADDAVLVIAEPRVDTARYLPLPGARAEGETVAEAFRSSGGLGAARVKALLGGEDATAVINALFERRYRIVHVAGHGVPPIVDKASGETLPRGVVLSDDTFLGRDEIHAMETVPELVFVNCCHLAARDARQVLAAAPDAAAERIDRAAFAAGVAEALIGIGVRCVVAAGWAVDDRPAQVFAEQFYRALLSRRPFVEAVAAAREATWRAAPRSHTWAAYQAYGDPNWVYRRAAGEQASAAPSPREEYRHVASSLGLELALEELAVKVQWMGADRAATREKLAHLEARFAERWGNRGAVAEAFGTAYKEVGDTDSAVRWYERAVAAPDGSASLQAQAQLGNQIARRAWATARAAAPGSEAMERARAEVQSAQTSLAMLAALQPTAERHALAGSAAKRLGLIEHHAGQPEAAARAFADAAAAYGQAWSLALANQDDEAYYPGLNRLSLDYAARGHADDFVLDAPTAATVRRCLETQQDREPDFWTAVGLVELDLLDALAARRLATEQARLVTRLTALHHRLKSVRMWGSVADNADLLLPLHAQRHPGAEAEAATGLLKLLWGWAGRQG